MTETQHSCLYVGEVMHRRAQPHHRLRYRVFSLLIDLDELPMLDARLRWFAHNRFNLVSFHDRDHGRCDGSPPRAWVDAALAAHGIETGGRIALLCFPRLFGYVFNPLSIFFCYAPSGALSAILYEVRNTFGDKHGYLIEVPRDHAAGAAIAQACAKAFHVSPFLPIAGEYRFRLQPPGARLAIQIRHLIDDAEVLLATHRAERRELTDATLLRSVIRHPLMTVKVIAGIHWEALFLWLKRARYHPRPAPPAHDGSFVRAAGPDLSDAA
ncbi:MAG: DUF1365 family protein [Proteobacteria bacterium]|nr:DUF1365 family protein [Pseudomonadota bacterium]